MPQVGNCKAVNKHSLYYFICERKCKSIRFNDQPNKQSRRNVPSGIWERISRLGSVVVNLHANWFHHSEGDSPKTSAIRERVCEGGEQEAATKLRINVMLYCITTRKKGIAKI